MLWLSAATIAAAGSATVRLRSDGQLNFAFGTEGSPTQQLRLERDTPFAADARVIHGNEPWVRDTAPPVLNVFRTRGVNDTTGDWARLTLSTPATMHTVRNRSYYMDALAYINGELLSVHASLPSLRTNVEVWAAAQVSVADASVPAVAHTLRLLSAGAHRRRRLELNSAAPPYARLSGCPAGMRAARLGLLLDHGFVGAHGGRDAALLAAAAAVSRANAVFEDQLGLRLLISTLVVNEGAGGEYASTGPNNAPTTPGTRSCPDYQEVEVTGHGVDVTVSGIEYGRRTGLELWTGRLAVPASAAPHPRWGSVWVQRRPRDDGAVGVGKPPRRGPVASDDRLLPRTGRGWPRLAAGALPEWPAHSLRGQRRRPGPRRQAQPLGAAGRVRPERLRGRCDRHGQLRGSDVLGLPRVRPRPARAVHGQRGCEHERQQFLAHVRRAREGALESLNQPARGESRSAAHTSGPTRGAAHEVGHGLGAEHTFGHGGLMDYNDERALYDNDDICAYLSHPSWVSCLEDVSEGVAAATCGNGALEAPEACDDGGTAAGDGCDATCAVECGWHCTRPLEGSSVCTPGCGNGAVDVELGEECDTALACCDHCRFAAGAVCCGGECCDDSGGYEPASTSCQTEDGSSGQCMNGLCTATCAGMGTPSLSGGCSAVCSARCLTESGSCVVCRLRAQILGQADVSA